MLRGGTSSAEQRCAVFEPRTVRITDREFGFRDRGSTVLALLVERIELQLELRPALCIDHLRRCHRHDALERCERSVLGVHPLAHMFYREEAAADHDVHLAEPGRSGGTHGVVGVLTRADDRRIPHPTRNLPGEAAGGRDGGDVAVGCHDIHVDGPGGAHHLDAVVLIGPVVAGTAIGTPVQPRLARGRGEQVFDREAVRLREPLGILPTSMMWLVYLRISRATSLGVLIPSTTLNWHFIPINVCIASHARSTVRMEQ